MQENADDTVAGVRITLRRHVRLYNLNFVSVSVQNPPWPSGQYLTFGESDPSSNPGPEKKKKTRCCYTIIQNAQTQFF